MVKHSHGYSPPTITTHWHVCVWWGGSSSHALYIVSPYSYCCVCTSQAHRLHVIPTHGNDVIMIMQYACMHKQHNIPEWFTVTKRWLGILHPNITIEMSSLQTFQLPVTRVAIVTCALSVPPCARWGMRSASCWMHTSLHTYIGACGSVWDARFALLCFALVCIGDFELSQLSCLSSSVGRASRLECGSSPTWVQPFPWKKLSQVLCCVVLLCSLSEHLSIHA